MPRPRRTTSAAVVPTTAMVASATRYEGKVTRIYRPNQPWQIECYRHYAICGEARYAAKYFGHALSRAVLGVSTVNADGEIEAVKTGPAHELLEQLFNGAEGQKSMLEACGVHLTIAGECYLVGRTDDQDTDIWEIVSIVEMKVIGTQWQINYQDGSNPIDLGDDDVVIRVWLPDPARKMEADSAFKSLLPILAEIEWLTKHVFAQVQSRLAGAGLLLLPSEMSFPPPPANEDGEAVATTDTASVFMATLADAMITPISDPESASAMVPIVVTAPADALDKAQLLHFWSELDSESKELRNEAIRRFALGVDMPPEALLGMSSNTGTGGGTSNGVSHWGAWQIEESTIKLHIEPMLDVVVNAITIGYLRKGVAGDSVEMVTYSTAALRLRPDRSKEAFELYDRGLLKAQVLLEENGFKVTDMPESDEFRQWLIRKIAGGSNTPEQVGAAAAMLGVALPAPEAPGLPPGTNEERPDPSLEDHPTRPRTPDEAALLAASDALVFRALERAGNRLRQQGVKPNCPSYETHRFVQANGNAKALLDDAWACAPQVLASVTDEPDKVIQTLNAYTTALLTTGKPHTREAMELWFK